ncbi:hypothetical protein ASD78_18720 [Lysobacter sp. Root667]|nr:hypothetical protein ASD78_18720 [Lysobacter sp. Root667]
MSWRRIALASILSAGVCTTAFAAPASDAGESALHERAMDDGTRLTRASLCGYVDPELERLNEILRVAAEARFRAAGREFDQSAYDAGFYAGMQRAMSQLLQLPSEQVEDMQRYRATHCAQVRSEIDALLAGTAPATP